MALDLTGIENVEFYSGHYLNAVLEGDLKTVFDRWKQAQDESGQRLPQEALGGIAHHYFTAREKAAGERDPVERLRLAQGVHAHLLEALDYERAPGLQSLEGEEVIPVHLALERDGNPFLWVVDAPFPLEEDDDPLASSPLPEQVGANDAGTHFPTSNESRTNPASWREIFDERLFRVDRAPRWVLFLAGSEAVLVERHKWSQGRYLRFSLNELFGRRQAPALRAMAALLHRDVLAPDAGLCLHDTLDENSHKHAFAVSGDLKHGVRRAVELIANEAVYYRREVQHLGVYNEEAFAEKLTAESLNWLYRLLFLFFVEARGEELEAVPMRSDAYRKGYSLESLRDLELVPLTTERARNGTFIHDSLQSLFRILNGGFPCLDPDADQGAMIFTDAGEMMVDALNSPLFDDERLEVLKGVRFRNHVLQEVLQLLSLSAHKKKKSRGRISYAQLGINQLGAVYEGLLSYTGFFATEDLYEVASEKDCKRLSGKPAAEREALKTHFVPASRIGDYREGEIVKDENEKKVVHQKGDFIFRLAGRNREKSASYYTPEVLTQCLVKYALKELLWEEGEKPRRKKTADEILSLTICEPAMGSSAFLIEAVDQLADAYLEVRQEERGETIPPEDYQCEKRRVKARLATNNCYGVDVNPTAVELAKVSLWLATLHEEGKCPWFGLRLATGNSLVGARREVFKTIDVTRKGTKADPNWLGLVPEPVPLHHSSSPGAQRHEGGPPAGAEAEVWAHWTAPPRPKGTIYHFLLPAEGMAAFDKDKIIKQLAPESVRRIKAWRKEFCKPFNKKDAERLEQISDAVDRLFAQVVRERVLATQETSDRIPVWGEPPSAQRADLLVRDQEAVVTSLKDGSSAYRRLKLAMDAWCALWFWPIEEAELLPDRATWLAQLELVLKGKVTHEPSYEQGNFFAALATTERGELTTSQGTSEGIEPTHAGDAERLKRLQALSNSFRGRRVDYFKECGLADVDSVLAGDNGLRTAQSVADRFRYHHWPLRFAEVFAERGGFDLILGNPPWIRLSFGESAVLSDADPIVALREIKGSSFDSLRASLLENANVRSLWFSEFAELVGTQSYIGTIQNYPLMRGVKANLYKCFVTAGWVLGSKTGVSGFLHPEGVYDDPGGGLLRGHAYRRLFLHAQFSNELKLFSEIGNRNRFSLNCYRSRSKSQVEFLNISNLFHPTTIDESWRHDGLGSVPRVKDEYGNWDLSGHADRIVSIGEQELRTFSDFYDDSEGAFTRTQLPVVHSERIVEILKQLCVAPRLGPPANRWATTREWNEGDRQDDGTIERHPCYPQVIEDLVYSGPHIYIGNSLYQTPNEGCSSHRDYTAIDIRSVDSDYLPRTVFRVHRDSSGYQQKQPLWNGKSIFQRFRHAHREMVGIVGERTLIAAILPPGAGSLGSVACAAFSNQEDMVLFNSLCLSLVSDFMVRTTGRGHIAPSDLERLPMIEQHHICARPIVARGLRLNCIASRYEPLWANVFSPEFSKDRWASDDRRLSSWQLGETWTRQCALLSAYERRRALVEIDVLTAIALGISVEALLEAYRVQFAVLSQHEQEWLYDQQGRIVASSKSASGNPAVSLVELGATLKEQAGFDVHAEYYPGGSNTHGLRKQKIRLGKKEADVLGVSERCTMADLLAETEVRWSDEHYPEGRPVRLLGIRYTDPGLEPRMERVYPTPWTRCDREADYRQAWAEFERRLGEKMAVGAPL